MPPMLYNRAGILIPPAITGFLLGSRTVYTSPSSSISYTPPQYCKLIFFQLQGGGGGGRNCANSSSGQIVLGGGGSAGGYVEGVLPPWFRPWTVTCAAGGSGTTGASGGTSSLNIPGFFSASVAGIFALGGAGGGGGTLATGTSTVFIAPTIGSAVSNSQTGISPQSHVSYEAHRVSGTVARSGRGADSFFGPGGRAVIAHGAGNNGSTGGGGSGGMSVNAAGAVAGGNGGDGIVILWEYY